MILTSIDFTVGYYRVNYDIQNWRKIARYLKSDNYTNIHVLNRAQIIDDAYHFLVANQLDPITFMDLASYLWQETDFIAWEPMFNMLYYTEIFCKYPENAFLKVSGEIRTRNCIRMNRRNDILSISAAVRGRTTG
jgi:hypothetical protein